MNIFVLDQDPTKAAKRLVNKHIGQTKAGNKWGSPKMAVEALQMLAVTYDKWGWPRHHKLDGNIYSNRSHPHHRCTKWAAESETNALWLLNHAIAICDRYQRITGSQPSIRRSVDEAASIFRKHASIPITAPANPDNFAVADGIQDKNDRFPATVAVKLYRSYYARQKV